MAVPKIKNRVNFAGTFLDTFVPGFRQGRQDKIRENELAQEQLNRDRAFQASQQAEKFRQDLRAKEEARAAEMQPYQLKNAELGVKSNELKLGGQQYEADVRLPPEEIRKRIEEKHAQEVTLFGQQVADNNANIRVKNADIAYKNAATGKLNASAIPQQRPEVRPITESDFAKSPRKVMQQINNLDMPDSAKNQLRKDVAKAHVLAKKKVLINDAFEKVKTLSGKESAETILGSVPGLKRLFPEAYTKAAQKEGAHSFFQLAIIGMIKAEPNGEKRQALLGRLGDIDALDPDSKLEAQKQMLLSIMGTETGGESYSALISHNLLTEDAGFIGSSGPAPLVEGLPPIQYNIKGSSK